MARAASDAVPTPASTMSGTRAKLADDAQVVDVLDPEARPNRGSERHDGRGARVLELAAHNRIVGRVRKHDEAFAHEDARCRHQLFVVREQCLLVADDLELTQFDNPASRPRRAVRTASSAV